MNSTAHTTRKIIHIDADCFYAAVETRDNPSLRGKPIAVGGSATRRGVIATASYEARKFGIHSAMASATAVKRCPQLILIPGRMSVYREASRQMHEIFADYTDLIEPLSLDEAFLDVSTCPRCRGSATLIAQEIRQRIAATVGITVSAGIAANKPGGGFQNIYVHAKIALIDDGWCTIGSTNIGNRSFYGDSELNASFWHEETVRALRVALLAEHLGEDTSPLGDRAAMGRYREVARANHPRWQAGEPLDGRGERALRLGLVNRGIGRCIDDHLRSRPTTDLKHGSGIRDIELGQIDAGASHRLRHRFSQRYS